MIEFNCVEIALEEVDCKKGGNIVRIYLQGKGLEKARLERA